MPRIPFVRLLFERVLQTALTTVLFSACAGDVGSSTGPTAVIKTPDAPKRSRDDEQKAKVDESTSTRRESGSVVFDLWHFSGYLVSMA